MTAPLTTSRDRRRAPRRVPTATEPIANLRLRGGREVAVVNLSSSGALVEGDVRLLPGIHVDVHVVTAHGRVLVRSRIARAYVAALCGERVTYRSALAFEKHVDIAAGYPIPAPVADGAAASGSAYPGPRT